ncbi:MAG TPA: MATE family efflux transporter [Sutterella wadsworthensis]|nr:MATE family efflux transporter [Sutterella wadsworthensis]HCG92972.1 MATE family efflux transporter [Sutterella wadsworthensis]
MSIALPLMMGLALEQLIGMTDVLFLGRYGEAELAAAGVAGIYVMLVMMLGLGYTVGSQSLMSRANGAGRAEEVGAIFRQSAIFMTACGFVIMLASWYLIGPMFERFIAAEAVRKAADDYVFWRLAGLPFAYVGLLARAYFVAVMHTRVITSASIVMVLVNCGLNSLLIFGLGPFPELGIAGAAIASAVSELAALAVYFLEFLRHAPLRELLEVSKHLWRLDWLLQHRIFMLSRWLMLQEAMAFGVWLYFFIVVENAGGERALALSNIVRQLGAVLFLFVHAFGSAAGTIAANYAGAGKPEWIRPMASLALRLCALVLLPFFLCFALFPSLVLGILTDLPEVISDAKPSFYVMVLAYALTTPAYLYFFVIGALGFAKESFRMTVTAVAAYGVYIAVLNLFTPPTAVYWTADIVYGLTLWLGVTVVWRRARAAGFRSAAADGF